MAKTILVVEDDKLLGKSVKGALEDAGYTVIWATDANEAYRAIEANDVGLVYLDIMLPGGVDGYEILRTLKKSDSGYDHIPVVMLSNLGQMGEIDRAMEIGASDYIVKANIDLSELVELTGKKTLL
jgi:DNA-binding response OmpR family regulator